MTEPNCSAVADETAMATNSSVGGPSGTSGEASSGGGGAALTQAARGDAGAALVRGFRDLAELLQLVRLTGSGQSPALSRSLHQMTSPDPAVQPTVQQSAELLPKASTETSEVCINHNATFSQIHLTRSSITQEE